MLFGRTLEYWVLLLLPVLNYTADEVEFVYKQFYDVSARKKQTDPSNSRICNDNVTRKKVWRKKAFFCHLAARRRQKTCVLMTQQLFWHVLWLQLGKTPVFSQSPFPTEIYGASNGRFWNTFDIENIKIRLSFSYQISLKSRRLSNLNIKSYPPPSQSVLGVKIPDGIRQDEPFSIETKHHLPWKIVWKSLKKKCVKAYKRKIQWAANSVGLLPRV